jgi:sulfofructose kinase
MKTPHIICLGGSATIDQIFYVESVPAPSAKISANEFVITGGGVAANAAVAVQRLGGAATYWGRVGQDSWGDQVLVMLAKEGVNIQYLRQLAGYRTKVATVLIDAQGERLVVSAQPQGYPDVIDWLPLHKVVDADAVLADTRWIGGAQALLDKASQHGMPSVLDGDSGDALVVRRLMLAATHPVLSEPMLTKLSGQTIDDASIGSALMQCFGGRNVIVGVTLGSKGVYWFDGKTVHHVASPKVAVVDTLAAGDTWHGALALALAQGQPLGAAIDFASRAAALKCTRRGGRLGIPTLDQLQAFNPALEAK